jgi:hypothetical protein
MKKSILGTIALSASFFAAGLFAADAAKAPAAAAEKPQKLVKVSTLSSVEANREFQSNVQILQAQRQALIELNGQYEKETDATKKKALKAKVDDALKTLNDNNQKMVKAYGFSLERNYTLQIEVAHVYMFVTDEEAAKIEKEQAAQAATAAAKKK